MCGYGPVVFGHGHKEVEDAAFKSRQVAGCLNHPRLRTVELAERLVDLVNIADWAGFAQNGIDQALAVADLAFFEQWQIRKEGERASCNIAVRREKARSLSG